MTLTFLLGVLGAAGGILVATGLFVLALRLVAHARSVNRSVREARRDPHARGRRLGRQPATDGRDISQ